MIRMPSERSAPKYAHIADVLQERIIRGTYATGSMLPSEAELVREFGASRSTVVRALELLRQLGYWEGQQGKGRFILGPSPRRRPSPPRRVHEALHLAEVGHGTVIGAGQAPASARIAAVLAIPVGEPVIARQRTMHGTGAEWLTLSTVYLPAVAAAGTRFTDTTPLREGVLEHLERRRRIVAADVVERLSARPATARESTILVLDPGAPVLSNLLIVHNSATFPLLAVELVAAPPPPGIEERFSLLS